MHASCRLLQARARQSRAAAGDTGGMNGTAFTARAPRSRIVLPITSFASGDCGSVTTTPPSPDDPCLLARNLGHRVPKIFLMIERNVGDDADPRLDHIGRIETSAHADFEHRDVDSLAREIFERDRRQHLEKTRMPGQLTFGHQPLGRAIHQFVDEREIVVRNCCAIHANALIDPNQVRRGVEPVFSPDACRMAASVAAVEPLPLVPAIRTPGNLALRMLQRLEQHPHVRQVELVRRRWASSWPSANIREMAVS